MKPAPALPPGHKASFAPVFRPDARLLVLGSLPGEASLAAQRYYAHPQNQFWRLMGGVTGTALAEMDYETRLKTLIAHRIALWDVVANAERQGSLDTAIRNVTANDLTRLVASLPHLRAIAFNGQRAAAIGLRQLGPEHGLPVIRLPSSSPAFTRALADKQAAWDALRDVLGP